MYILYTPVKLVKSSDNGTCHTKEHDLRLNVKFRLIIFLLVYQFGLKVHIR